MKVLGMKMRFGALTRAALSAGIFAASTVAVQAQSLYGCNDLAGYERLPSIEGKSGVFFRINPDLYNFHAMSEETVDQVAELARALESVGTKLIYVPMPTKSMVMPSFLTSESEDFGFDATLASTVYGEAVRRLRDHLPLVRPALAALAVLVFTFIWNDFFWALVLVQSDEVRPVTAGLSSLQGQWLASWQFMSAGAVVAAIPPVVLFFTMQKHFIAGLTLGATKG